MRPIDDVRDISRIAYGFIASKAFFAALEFNVFGELKGTAKPLEALAKTTGVLPPRLKTLLANLVSLGLVTRADDLYANSPAAERYLVPGSPAYFGDYYRLQVNRQLYPAAAPLEDALKGDEAKLAFAGEESLMGDPEQAAIFSRAQHAGSLGPAIMLSRSLDLSNRRRLLDVAGGTGAFSIALCKQNPNLTAVVLDFPNVAALAKTYIEDAGLTSRISTIGANALAAEWPADQDVVLMSYLLSAVAADAIDLLIAKAHAAFSPGGLLVVHDFMLDDDELGPSLAAEWFLLSLALNTRAISFTAADISHRLARTGFVDITSREHIHEITKLVLAHKPAG